MTAEDGSAAAGELGNEPDTEATRDTDTTAPEGTSVDVIRFKHSISGKTADGAVLVALIGDGTADGADRCVGLLLCEPEPARGLIAGVGSALMESR